jgi:superfamily I DNA/RNA helicase
MSRDRHVSAVPGLKQCFVARSKKVRELMRSLQERYCSDEDLSHSRFLKFEDLLRECRQSRDNDNVDAPRPRLFSKSRKVGFQRFKGIYPGLRPKQQLDPLVAWAQIRSYIKGSAEAVGKNGPLSREEYTALGKDRCRLTLEQREEAYETYEAYQRYLKANDCFDDVDEVFDLFLNQLDPREWVSEHASNLRYHKIYVDEVQDYTVAELAVLVMLSGPRSLFLAGDTAQSVEEGVSFRFEEVRQLMYNLAGQNRSLVPDKPEKLCLNFRSHAGILDVAAAVLERLSIVFPFSIDKLPADQGLCRGPRPLLVNVQSARELSGVLDANERLIVLTPDDQVERVQRDSGKDRSVFGIRESKGLEYSDVAVVDFFASLEPPLQMAWKDVLRVTDATDPTMRRSFPEIEAKLKLLYTAITRCQHKLLFIETKKSVAAASFFRWLTDKKLGEVRDRRCGKQGKQESSVPGPSSWHSCLSVLWRTAGRG